MESCTNSVQASSQTSVTPPPSAQPVLRFDLPDDPRHFCAFRCNLLKGKAPTGLPLRDPYAPAEVDTEGRPSCIDTSDDLTIVPGDSKEPDCRYSDDDQIAKAVTAMSR